MKPTKIIVFGFPHCGTTILKNIIGHIDNVEEIIKEKIIILDTDRKTDKKYILCKHPFFGDSNHFFTDKYKDYIKIFIIRDPMWVFSSLNKRCSYKIPANHSIERYIKTCQYFIKYSETPIENLYLLRYEDMFDENGNYITMKTLCMIKFE